MDNSIGIVILLVCVLLMGIACIVLLALVLIRQGRSQKEALDTVYFFDKIKDEIAEGDKNLRRELADSVQSSVKTMGDMVSGNQKDFFEMQGKRLDDMDKAIADKQDRIAQALRVQIGQFEESIAAAQRAASEAQREATKAQNARLAEMDKSVNEKQTILSESIQAQMKQLETRFQTLETTNTQKLAEMRETMEKHLFHMQEDNNKKLDEIRTTVDEKLQKTLEEKMTNSFQLVSERLEQVYKGLGEMQTIAGGVGDLKKVLSNVKTRGILGEIQLGAILSEILHPEQYDTEVPTVPGSSERVEFAVKLPAKEGEFIYLPIDSKFPGDTYGSLQDAYAAGNPEEIKAAYKALETVIKKCAKEIRDKYICPPHTTNFAIMFLPFEGLYAEVVNHSLVEVLQREYCVNIAGPSTMAAMLNSLQMGFQTLQIQKRSNEVWELLSAVKTEFDTFEKVFESAKNRIRQLDEEMDKLVGTRTRAIQRKLRNVQKMDAEKSQELLKSEEQENE